MNRAEKERVETLRKTNAIKTMYYTRYFMVRYVVTFFFFVNLYWAIMLYLSKASAVAFLPILLELLQDLPCGNSLECLQQSKKKQKLANYFSKQRLR